MNFRKKYADTPVQAKAAIWFAVCGILQKGVSFFTVPIFTRLLTSEQYGTYSLYLSWLQIVTILSTLYLYYGTYNNGLTKYEEDRDRYVSSAQGLTVTITAVIFAVYLCFRGLFSKLLGLSQLVIALMFLQIVMESALQYWSGRQRFEYKYKRLVVVTMTKTLLNPLLGLIAVYLSDERDTARILSIVACEFIIGFPLFILLFCKGKSFCVPRYWKYSLTLALPLLPHYLSSAILGQGDRIMIENMLGKSEVAYYSVAYNIGMIVQVFTSSINNALTPWIYQNLKSKTLNGMAQVINKLAILVGFGAFCMSMFAPEIVLIFGSESYRDAAYVIPPVAASVFFIFMYNIMAIPQFYFEKTQFLMITSIVIAALNLVLNYIFIPIYGYVAAAYTTLVCYVLYSGSNHFMSNRAIRKNCGSEKAFDDIALVIISAIVSVACLSTYLVFGYPVLRYVFLGGAGIVAIIKRKDLMAMIRFS